MKLTNVNLLERGKLTKKLLASFVLFFFLFACGGGDSQQQQEQQQENVVEDTTDNTDNSDASEEEETGTFEALEETPYTGESLAGQGGWKAIGPNQVVMTNLIETTNLTGDGFNLVAQTEEASCDVFCWVTEVAYIQAMDALGKSTSSFTPENLQITDIVTALTDAQLKTGISALNFADDEGLRTRSPLEELMDIAVLAVESATKEVTDDDDGNVSSSLTIDSISDDLFATFLEEVSDKLQALSPADVAELDGALLALNYSGPLIASLADGDLPDRLADDGKLFKQNLSNILNTPDLDFSSQQVPCYCNDNNDYYCVVPSGAPTICGLIDENGSPTCTFEYDVSTVDGAEGTIGVVAVGGKDLVASELTTCSDGTGTVKPDDMEASVTGDFKHDILVNFPNPTTVAAIFGPESLDAYMIGFFDEARGEGGCFGPDCGGPKGGNQRYLTGSEGYSLVQGYQGGGEAGGCYWDDGKQMEKQREICPGDHFSGGDHYGDRYGFDHFNPVLCDAAGYNVPEFIYNTYATQQYGDQVGKGFNRSEANFQFSIADGSEGACDRETRADGETCLVDITVNIAGGEDGEEIHTFASVPLTGVDNSFLIRSDRALGSTEIVEEALQDWGREWLEKRNDVFFPVQPPFLDSWCSPIQKANQIRQYFGYDELEGSEYADIVADQHGGYTPPYYGDPNKEQGKICGEDAGTGEESSLMTLEVFCFDANGNLNNSAEDFQTVFPTIFTVDEDDGEDKVLFSGTDLELDGLRDDFGHMESHIHWNTNTIVAGCFGDADGDGILNWYDPFNNSEEDNGDENHPNNKDFDEDGVKNKDDNCPFVANTEQEATSGNGLGVGDACMGQDKQAGMILSLFLPPNFGFDFSWCQADIQNRINDQWSNIDENLYEETLDGDAVVYAFVDADKDGLPDLLDSCIDETAGDGFFFKGNDTGIECAANSASDALKNIAIDSAIAVCDAYDDNSSISSYWAGDDLGLCRANNQNKDSVEACAAAGDMDSCWSVQADGGCWWNNLDLRQSLIVLRELGVDLNVAQWEDDPDLRRTISHLNGGAQKEYFFPNYWVDRIHETPLQELDDHIAAYADQEKEWSNDELRRISEEAKQCRQMYTGNKKDLVRRQAYIAGVQKSLTQLYDVRVDRSDDTSAKKYICEFDGFNAQACLNTQDYDKSNKIDCPANKMTECSYTKLQGLLDQAFQRLHQWAEAQANVNKMYAYIEKASRTASEDDCLPIRLATTEELEEKDLLPDGEEVSPLVDRIAAFNAAYDEDNDTNLFSSQERSSNHMNCINMDQFVDLAKRSCLAAPVFGSKDAYDGISREQVEKSFLVQPDDQQCEDNEFFNHFNNQCEEEIRCRVPPGAEDLLCIDSVVGSASIAEACTPSLIKEKIFMAGNKPYSPMNIDGETIYEDEIFLQVVQMVTHDGEAGVETLFSDACKVTLKVPAYDNDGCWMYYDKNNTAEERFYFSDTSENCETDDEGDKLDAECLTLAEYIAQKTAESDDDYSPNWVRQMGQETIPLGQIAERNIMKMKLKDAAQNDTGLDWLREFGDQVGGGGSQ